MELIAYNTGAMRGEEIKQNRAMVEDTRHNLTYRGKKNAQEPDPSLADSASEAEEGLRSVEKVNRPLRVCYTNSRAGKGAGPKVYMVDGWVRGQNPYWRMYLVLHLSLLAA